MVHRKSSRINTFFTTLFKRLVLLALLLLAFLTLAAGWIQLGREERAVEIVRPENPQPAPAVAPDTLRIVTYNIAHARGPRLNTPNSNGESLEERRDRLNRMGEDLRELRADIIFLQEVDFNTWWSHGLDQADLLAEITGMPYRVKQRNVDTGLPFWRRWDFGNVLLSRLPVTDAEKLSLPPYSDFEQLVAGNHDALMASVNLGGGKTLRIMGVHLEVRSEETRVQAAQQLIAAQRAISEPMILLGDLNSTPPGFPDSQTTRLGQNAVELLESFGGFQRRPARGQATHRDFTFPTEAPRRIIDWILPDGNFRILDYRVHRDVRESDHLPVSATLRRR